jgi:hypothetical protein
MLGLIVTTFGVPLAMAAPRATALVLLWALIAFEPTTFDVSRYIADGLYVYPPEFSALLPLTIVPWEVILVALAVRLAVKPLEPRPDMPKVPWLFWAVPVAVLVSYLWGWFNGGMANLGYIEARGVIYGGIAFFVGRRVFPVSARAGWILVLSSTLVLAVITFSRYFFIARTRVLGDLAFSHESPTFLAVGAVAGGVALLSAKNPLAKVLLVLYEIVLLSAMMSSGRRAGTLAFLYAALMFVVFVVRHRRVMIPVALAGAVVFAGYLSAFWNSESGVIGQPARAVRSQYKPSQRDYNSDLYRLIETYNVTQTIRMNPLMGVGLGRPFIEFAGLPYIGGWSLQRYTPHDNLLWVWLKFGLPGSSVILGVWALSLSRAFEAGRQRRPGEIPTLAIVCGSAFVVAIAYSQVDQFFVNARAITPYTVMAALIVSVRTVPVAVTEAVTARRPERRLARYVPGAVS